MKKSISCWDIDIYTHVINKDIGKIKSPLDTIIKGGEMVSEILRQASWINEVEFDYSRNAIARYLSEEAMSILLVDHPEDIHKLLERMKPQTYARILHVALSLTQDKITAPHLQISKNYIFKDLDINEATLEKIKRLQGISIKEIGELQKELKSVKSKKRVSSQ